MIDTWDVWYGSVSLVSRLDLKRVRLWGGAGLAFGADHGRQEVLPSTCTTSGDVRNCEYYATDHIYPHEFHPSLHFIGGVDVPVGRQFSAFVQVGNVASAAVVQAGVRVALRSIDALAPATLSAVPRVSPTGQPTGAPVRLNRGTSVWVTTMDGVEHTGEVSALSADQVSLVTRTGTLALPFARIMRIERPDPRTNGLVKGALIGAGSMFGLALLSGLFGGADEAPEVGAGLLLTGIGAGAGALIGAGLDALVQGRVVAFEAPATRTVTMAPILGAHRAGFGMTVRW